ncbi:hypothetical protein VTJ04DRAFT_5731 [Mycothermus thermophilus]|uniref:uncharacterized protein n=1 Tax=Humicola insolens TaxID=85995 RepID=UPI0037421497
MNTNDTASAGDTTTSGNMPFECAPIPTECFAPPPTSWPRAWERVPVRPVPGRRRQSKIWKRLGGVPPVPDRESYTRAMSELESQGLGSRKRVRPERHAPAIGNVMWDPRVEQVQQQREDIERDLEEARVAVSLAEQQTADQQPATSLRVKPATFPEENLKWIPRKRHNSRWPIQPAAGSSPAPAMPAASEPVEVALKVDETHLKKRSTRRASSRLSLSPRKLALSTTPAKLAPPLSSPIKRASSLSPTKVANSPLSAFRVKATPTRVVLEPSDAPALGLSPSKSARSPSSPPAHASTPQVDKSSETPDSPADAASPAPLLFDQPVQDPQPESQDEVRRRVFLQSARRTERTPAGIARLLALKNSQNSSSSRRHSLTSLERIREEGSGERKGRRKTMDVTSMAPDAARVSDRVVEVDMRTSIDIFAEVGEEPVDLLPVPLDGADGKQVGTESGDKTVAAESNSLRRDSTTESRVGAGTSGAAAGQATSSQDLETPLPSELSHTSKSLDISGDVSTSHGSDNLLPASELSSTETSSDEASSVPPSSSSDTMLSEHASSDPAGMEPLKSDSVHDAGSPPTEGSVEKTSPAPEPRPVSHVASSASETTDSPKDHEADSIATGEEQSGAGGPTPTCDVPSGPASEAVMADENLDEANPPTVASFTPINGRQSPTNTPLSQLRDDDETSAPLGSDDMDADEVVEEEVVEDDDNCDAPAAMDEDVTVEAPRPEADTLQLHGRQDDSETEMLRNFVSRVAADKSARAAAAAAALAQKCARRSSLLASMTSSTGSPMMRDRGGDGDRAPLRARSPNSPSPTRKRKLDDVEDEAGKDATAAGADCSADAAGTQSDRPRLKRRRKLANPTPETTLNSSASTEDAACSPSPVSRTAPSLRRSTRPRPTRIALRPSAPSANSIALSMFPVRLPGMGALSSPDEAPFSPGTLAAAAARQRSEEKDLAALTRANTRKNKGGAVPPQVVLARQAEDPTWKMKELKGVYEAKETRGGDASSSEAGDAADAAEVSKASSKKAPKSVRWAEQLVEYHQPDDEEAPQPSAFRSLATQLLADVTMADTSIEDVVGVDEIAEAEPPAPPEPVVEKTVRVAPRRTGKAAAAAASSTTTTAPAPQTATATAGAPPPARLRRSTRSSRLPPPTPVKKMQQKATTTKQAAEKTAAPKKAVAAASTTSIPAPPATTTTTPATAAAQVAKPSAPPSLRSRARKLPKLVSAAGGAGSSAAVKSAVAAVSAAAETESVSAVLAPSRAAAAGTTRRSGIAKLGMSVNGTPAPKRRGRAAAAAAAGV